MPVISPIISDGVGKFIVPHPSGELVKAASASIEMPCFKGGGLLRPTLQMAGKPVPSLAGSVGSQKIVTANAKLSIAHLVTPVNPSFNEYGGIDEIITLFSKPASGTLIYDFDSTNLVPWVQPPITDEKQFEWASCTETDAYDKDGNVVAHRPIEMVGGIVWYHTSKGGMVTPADVNNRITTGKAQNWYAMIDNYGNYWRWRILNASQVELYPVDPSVLNKSYPLTIAPVGDTFGYTSIGGSYLSSVYNTFRGELYTCSASGTATSISWYGRVSTGTWYTYCGLYNGSSPASFIAGSKTNRTTIPTSNGWIACSIPATQPSILAQDYRITYQLQDTGYSATYYINDDAVGSSHECNASLETLGTFPSSVTFTDDDLMRLQAIYVTYTPGGGGITPPPSNLYRSILPH